MKAKAFEKTKMVKTKAPPKRRYQVRAYETKFKIEKGIPIPPKRWGGYPFADMQKGDSFLVENKERVTRAARAAMSQYSKRSKTKYTTRLLREGMRIWRTK